MPIFYFDIDNGSSVRRDNDGVELADFKAVRTAAINVLPGIARDELPDGDSIDFIVSVRDSDGDVVFRASLRFRTEHVGKKGSALI